MAFPITPRQKRVDSSSTGNSTSRKRMKMLLLRTKLHTKCILTKLASEDFLLSNVEQFCMTDVVHFCVLYFNEGNEKE